MGFFSRLKAKVCNGIGKALERIGEITHIDAIEMAGINLQIDNPIDNFDNLDINEASVQDTIDLHVECEKSRKQAANQAEQIETECIEGIERRIEIYLEQLEQIIPKEALSEFDYSVGGAFTKEIRDTISSYVAKKISQDNEEFIEILRLEKEERKVKSDEYIKSVLANAKLELKNKCNNKFIALCKKMYQDLDEYFSLQRNLTEEMEKNYRMLAEHKGDIEYQKNEALIKVVDMAHAQCIKTLTYSNY